MTNFANGANLLLYRKDENREDYVILAQRDNMFVTARMGALTDKEWYWGHYTTDLDKAHKDFKTR